MSALNPTARDLANVLKRLETRIDALERGARTSQLQHASLTGTAINVYDQDGVTPRGAIGIQPDGTLGLVAVGGPPPGAPSAPVVTPSLGGLSVVWDGTLDDGSTLPADFDHIAVHVSTEDGFTPAPTTFAGTITRAGDGGRLPVVPLPYQTNYVRLVGVNTSSVSGPASAQTAGTPAQVDGPDLTAGSVTAATIAAGAVTAQKLEAVLALVTRIVAGDPAGSRVELNEDGLRVYNSSGALTVSFDGATGDAVFTGTITGSDVTGGTITGATVQTGTSGQRLALNPGTTEGAPPTLDIYTGDTDETGPGGLYAGLGEIVMKSPQRDSDAQAYVGVGSAADPYVYLNADGVRLQVGGVDHFVSPQVPVYGLLLTVGNVKVGRWDANGLTVSGQPVPVPQPPIAPAYSAWTTPQNTNYQSLRLIADGTRVFLDGSASTATAFTGSQTAFTVPAALCPKKDHYLGLVRATSGDPRFIGCRIQSSGVVTVYASTTVAVADTWDFTDISWSLV